MNAAEEAIKIYKQIKKLEKRYDKTGEFEKFEQDRIMKKCLKLQKRLNFLTGKQEGKDE